MLFTQKQMTETAGWWGVSKSSDLDTLGVTCLSDIYCQAAGYVSMELRKEVWGSFISRQPGKGKEGHYRETAEWFVHFLYIVGKLLPSRRFVCNMNVEPDDL